MSNLNKKVEIDGIKYEIDVEKAESLGLLKKEVKKITSFEVGDVFKDPIYNNKILIIQTKFGSDHESKYDLGGYDGLKVYSDNINSGGLSFYKMVEYLNRTQQIFVKNINNEIKALINS